MTYFSRTLDFIQNNFVKPEKDPNLRDSYKPQTFTYVPPGMRSMLFKALREAEELKGGPVTLPEMTAVLYHQKSYVKHCLTPIEVAFALQILYLEDSYYADPDFGYVTTRGATLPGFMLFSERFQQLYASKGYILDNEMRIRASPRAQVVNLHHLLDVLNSTDEEKYIKDKWIFDGHDRFFDGQPKPPGHKVSFVSFPRSGNSFMRKYLDKLTGITTGSDNPITCNVPLLMSGQKGEYLVDDTVWVVKSHHPWSMQDEAKVSYCNKVLQIVRNPLDSIISFLNLVYYAQHSLKSPFEPDEEYPQIWNNWVERTVKNLETFYNENMNLGLNQDNKAPTLWIRFEDLVANPEMCLRQISRFLLNRDDITGTNIERRIMEIVQKMDKKTFQTYKLKSNTLKFNPHLHRYTKDQLNMCKSSLKRMLYYFGYIKHPINRAEDSTAFFELDEDQQHDDVLLKTFCQFRSDNEQTLKFLSEHSHEQIGSMYNYCMKKTNEEQCNIFNTDISRSDVTPSVVDYYKKELYPHEYTQSNQ